MAAHLHVCDLGVIHSEMICIPWRLLTLVTATVGITARMCTISSLYVPIMHIYSIFFITFTHPFNKQSLTFYFLYGKKTASLTINQSLFETVQTFIKLSNRFWCIIWYYCIPDLATALTISCILWETTWIEYYAYFLLSYI